MRPKEERISPRLTSSDLNLKETNNCKAQAELGSTDADAITDVVQIQRALLGSEWGEQSGGRVGGWKGLE